MLSLLNEPAIEPDVEIKNPDVPLGMRECARPSCGVLFEGWLRQLYCSPRCQKAECERRRHIRYPEKRRADNHLRTRKYRDAHPEYVTPSEYESFVRQERALKK